MSSIEDALVAATLMSHWLDRNRVEEQSTGECEPEAEDESR